MLGAGGPQPYGSEDYYLRVRSALVTVRVRVATVRAPMIRP